MGRPFIWVALDGLSENEDKALSLVRELDRSVSGHWGIKVNADWIYWKGFEQRPLKKLPDRPVFVDLKQWFGARTMTKNLEMVSDAGATATNIYSLAGALNPTESDLGGPGEFTKALKRFRKLRPDSKMRIYGVSILTHYGTHYVRRHFGRTMEEELTVLAEDTRDAGAEGIIMPGSYLAHADQLPCLGELLKVFPGTRWDEFKDTRHEQEIHPSMVRGRDDVELVCGSPVCKSPDPVFALRTLLSFVS